jgi:outer membrane protein assembly factor BamB
MSIEAMYAGQFLGPYRRVRQLGAGGMGRVFLAYSPGGREVALKLLRLELAASAAYRERFALEVTAAKAVNSMYTAPVIDADPFGSQPWLATAYIPGPDLGAAVRSGGPLAEMQLRELAAGLAEALTEIHSAGVVHGDLKPSNVLMAPDGPRVIDFGISKDLAFLPGIPSDTPLGTSGFAPPEQITLEQPVSRAGDVFSLGALLAFAASGHPPFGEGTPAAIQYRVVYEEPDLHALSASMRETVAACLSKDPGLRPAPGEVLRQLAPPARGTATGTGEDPVVSFGAATTGAAMPTGTGPASGAAGLPVVPHSELAGAMGPPGGSAAPRGSSRRRLLIGAGAALGCGAAAGVAALLVSLSDRSPQNRKAGSATRPGRVIAGSVSSLPKGPAPVWSVSPAEPPRGAAVLAFGNAVVWGTFSGYLGGDITTALVYDAATGRQLWNGPDKVPADAPISSGFFGVWDSVLYGGIDTISACTIFGLDSSGNRVAQQTFTGYLWQLWAISGQMAFVSQYPGEAAVPDPSLSGETGTLSMISLRTGATVWTAPPKAYSFSAVAVDSTACYLYGASTLTALDRATGAKKWSVPGELGTDAYITVADGAVIAAGSSTVNAPGPGGSFAGLAAFDPATGTRLWSTPSYTPIGIVGATVYAQGTVASSTLTLDSYAALDSRTGKAAWTFHSPVYESSSLLPTNGLLSGSAGWASEKIVAFPYDAGSYSLSGGISIGEPGFMVLSAATGKPIWVHQGSPDDADEPLTWPAAITGDMVIAASQTTLYAFKAGS